MTSSKKYQKLTRIPYLNKEGKVIGVINEKNVFDVLADEEIKEEDKIKEILREPVFISYRRLLPYALEKIQRNAEHMLIVVDNLKERFIHLSGCFATEKE